MPAYTHPNKISDRALAVLPIKGWSRCYQANQLDNKNKPAG